MVGGEVLRMASEMLNATSFSRMPIAAPLLSSLATPVPAKTIITYVCNPFMTHAS
jgi:hypothetical protein